MSQVAIIEMDPRGKGRAFLSESINPLTRRQTTSRKKLDILGSEAKAWSVGAEPTAASFVIDRIEIPYVDLDDTDPNLLNIILVYIKNIGGTAGRAFYRVYIDDNLICDFVVGADIPAGDIEMASCPVTTAPDMPGTHIVKAEVGTVYEAVSDTKTLSYTIKAIVTAAFVSFTPYGGPFTAGTTQSICKFGVKNTGTAAGTIYYSADQLDAGGGVIGAIDSGSAARNPGESLWTDPSIRDMYWLLPAAPGTYYVGAKVWGADEAEPSYPTPTALMAAIGEEEGRGIVKLIKCMFPRLITKTPTPRITNKEMTPRIDCIKESEIIPLRSKSGALGATRGRKLGGRLLAKVITVNGVKYREI